MARPAATQLGWNGVGCKSGAPHMGDGTGVPFELHADKG